ncbi:TetR/AcrR family transcriptional regulator C-terminal domain-containing protein [Streptomyces yunnanensis]|uniref:TetR/AcrR family transcriptional regulator C-terminal domain-containing protein n=1 Tax=Streptomyces yunnanensis TaxID=156453 RepID=A0ABY8AHF5_9ACTN|nr:TetR/AcrR family transcriptional regulator C-terminal domain-containing protein [Streptomyces yunnanensis]WEB44086.1 TetR/AcrR family transcriptional regulator C-terminal domain-containing protein [Streptomyces yunnanensis]
MTVFAGQGDARRSLSLLWRAEESDAADRPRPTRGPKPALSVDAIVAAGIAVADAEGMAALSMRSVGERLGRTAMALYTYVPGKTELVDLMYDQALAELPTDYDLSAGWQSAVTSWATDTWEFSLRHPWVLQVSQARPVLGPHEYTAMETLLRVLYTTGLDSAALRRIVGVLFHFVRGAARTVAESREAATATGVTDEDWWRSRAGTLTEVVPDFAERFPLLVRLETEGASPPPEEEGAQGSYLEREARATFDAGLTVILDGIEAAVARQAARPPR